MKFSEIYILWLKKSLILIKILWEKDIDHILKYDELLC